MTLDATRRLADEGLAGEPTTEAGRRLAEAIASLDERLPIDPGDAILAIEVEAADPLWRVAEAARFHNKTPTGATRACLDGCIACEALAALDANVEETP